MFGTVTAVVGTNSIRSGGNSYKVSAKSQHAHYVDKHVPDWMYDIGVFTLGAEVRLSDCSERVGLVRLPRKDASVGSQAIVSGWGTTQSPTSPASPTLQKLTLDVISLEACKDRVPNYARVHPSRICTFVKRGVGTCSGDSGGPLVQNGVIIGVVSGGIPCARGYPDIFTNVFSYLDYLSKAMQ